jgi:hypothetical protein
VKSNIFIGENAQIKAQFYSDTYYYDLKRMLGHNYNDSFIEKIKNKK